MQVHVGNETPDFCVRAPHRSSEGLCVLLTFGWPEETSSPPARPPQTTAERPRLPWVAPKANTTFPRTGQASSYGIYGLEGFVVGRHRIRNLIGMMMDASIGLSTHDHDQVVGGPGLD